MQRTTYTDALLVRASQPANRSLPITWTEFWLRGNSALTVAIRWRRTRGSRYLPLQAKIWYWRDGYKYTVEIPASNIIVED